MASQLISDQQIREIRDRTGAQEATILRRVVGLHVRGAAAYAVDVELERLGVMRSTDQEPRR
jgi:hypothetical protein